MRIEKLAGDAALAAEKVAVSTAGANVASRNTVDALRHKRTRTAPPIRIGNEDRVTFLAYVRVLIALLAIGVHAGLHRKQQGENCYHPI